MKIQKLDIYAVLSLAISVACFAGLIAALQ